MSWSWSHTRKAYHNARLNVQDLDHETLVVIVAEIETSKDINNWDRLCFNPSFHEDIYQEKLAEYESIPSDVLADHVWRFMEKLRRCDNGGFNAHCCPYGCHKVSFDRDNAIMG